MNEGMDDMEMEYGDSSNGNYCLPMPTSFFQLESLMWSSKTSDL